jgi:hypothetical protein
MAGIGGGHGVERQGADGGGAAPVVGMGGGEGGDVHAGVSFGRALGRGGSKRRVETARRGAAERDIAGDRRSARRGAPRRFRPLVASPRGARAGGKTCKTGRIGIACEQGRRGAATPMTKARAEDRKRPCTRRKRRPAEGTGADGAGPGRQRHDGRQRGIRETRCARGAARRCHRPHREGHGGARGRRRRRGNGGRGRARRGRRGAGGGARPTGRRARDDAGRNAGRARSRPKRRWRRRRLPPTPTELDRLRADLAAREAEKAEAVAAQRRASGARRGA